MTPEALVARYGWNAASVQALNPGLLRWQREGAFVAYARARQWPGGPAVWLGAGEPICAPGAQHDAAQAFARDAASVGASAAWFGASGRFREAWTGAELVLGAQPVWDPADWPEILSRKASLRQQINRARNKGVTVAPLAPERARTLEPIRQSWLARRGLPPLDFLVQTDVLRAPGPRRFLVATRGERRVGYLVLAPVPAREGVFVEWIIQAPEAPNGTASLLLDAAFREAAASPGRRSESAAFLTLGMVPLSTHAPPTDSPPPAHLRALLWWMRAHARRFYNFEGLERFKAKFEPLAWEPLYLLAPEAPIGLPLLHAVADAFAGPRSPEALIAQALARAAADEVSGVRRSLRQRLSGR
ncbi:phosphatidylglycerol lysyltransferase domain-containing protein [Rubricoccus marinus]|uniref:Phosphatidylglycerol lysyltransferase C-terminal domain-containing protein n=1 Tax=Rubricoccus marinus TaxID=716817 RepID=A0A259TXM5_9BACT|nr:phosphatidylglycerol lysyltransferase domain-containing protein [Rubricoccus marinus]OZC02499.1 hypothetical protein BSZ36_05610 [Rubricoccus marinus]